MNKETKMNKPNNPKCNSCFVINNKLRCSLCKHKTEEWLAKNVSSIMFIDNCDYYKEANKGEAE